MGKYLRATAIALEKAVGPLAFPLTGLRSLMEDEAAEARFESLLGRIAAGEELGRELFNVLAQIEGDGHESRQQFRSGINVVLTTLQSQQELLTQLMQQPAGGVPEPKFQQALIAIDAPLRLGLVAANLLTEQELVNELCRLFPRSPEFLAVVGPAGFPVPNIAVNVSARQTHAEFIEVLRGLDRNTCKQVFAALYTRCPGSAIFSRWARLYQEATEKPH